MGGGVGAGPDLPGGHALAVEAVDLGVLILGKDAHAVAQVGLLGDQKGDVFGEDFVAGRSHFGSRVLGAFGQGVCQTTPPPG